MPFTEPPVKNPKIPDPVPIENLSAEKKALYQGLDAKVDEDVPVPDVTEEAPTLKIEVTEDPYEPTADEKKEFLRSILGRKEYAKVYVLFGETKATFVDRSVVLSDKMYKQLQQDSEKIGAVSTDEWSLWIDRYTLAATFRAREDSAGGESYPAPEIFWDRVQVLMALPRPLFEALMTASADFNDHVALLTERAQAQNFWQADGQS